MHCTMIFGSVLASGSSDPGVLYTSSCKAVPMVLALSFLALAFTLLDVLLMMLTFLYLRRRDGHRLWVALVLHVAASASVRYGRLTGLLPAHRATYSPSLCIFMHADALQPALQWLHHHTAARLPRDGVVRDPGCEGAPQIGCRQPRVDMTWILGQPMERKCT
jgi:hypothetical protein